MLKWENSNLTVMTINKTHTYIYIYIYIYIYQTYNLLQKIIMENLKLQSS